MDAPVYVNGDVIIYNVPCNSLPVQIMVRYQGPVLTVAVNPGFP